MLCYMAAALSDFTGFVKFIPTELSGSLSAKPVPFLIKKKTQNFGWLTYKKLT